MQHPDNHPGDNRAENTGIDRLNADHVLDVIGFENGCVGSGQNPLRRQPEIHRQIHDSIADETGKCRDAFVLTRQT
ncbi:hypothetical protein D3C78_1186410 [compost metagenome]